MVSRTKSSRLQYAYIPPRFEYFVDIILVGGVEVDIHPLEPSTDFPRLRELCNVTGLELGLMLVIEHSRRKKSVTC